jgi:nucleoside-diphosphate-sugar epimerase
MSRLLVTGGSGFVGSHTVVHLARAGHDIRVLARDPAKLSRVLAAIGELEPEVCIGDMTDPAIVARALDGVDGVVHCAGEIGVAGGSAPKSSANVVGGELVLGGAVQAGLDPIIYTSSLMTLVPTTETVVTPASPLTDDTLSDYARQKIEVDRRVRRWQAEGAPITTLVLGAVAGPGCAPSDGISQLMAAALLLGMMAPEQTGTGVVDVRDIAAIITRCVEPAPGPRRYLVTGRWLTWRDWSTELGTAIGAPVSFNPIAEADLVQLGRTFDAQRSEGAELPPLSEEAAVVMCAQRAGDDSATLRDFGITYRPTVDTLRDTVAWLRQIGVIS